VIIFE